jgi:hypothetical protein
MTLLLFALPGDKMLSGKELENQITFLRPGIPSR